MGYIQDMRAIIGHDRLMAVGAGVFVFEDRKVLLQKRRDNSRWGLHGGIVEMGEQVEDTAKRELLEETGLIANKLELLGVFSGEDRMYTYPNGDKTYIIGIVYVCSDYSGELLPETDETLELRWFDIDHLPQEISPPNVKPLEAFVRYMKGKDAN